MKLAMTEVCRAMVKQPGFWKSGIYCGKTAEVYVLGLLMPFCQKHFEEFQKKHSSRSNMTTAPVNLILIDLEDGKRNPTT